MMSILDLLLAFGVGIIIVLGGVAVGSRVHDLRPYSIIRGKSAVWYHAKWCKPCQRMKPTIMKMKKEGYDILTRDVDNGNDNVGRVPTLIIYPRPRYSGEAMHTLVGYKTRTEIEKHLMKPYGDKDE